MYGKKSSLVYPLQNSAITEPITRKERFVNLFSEMRKKHWNSLAPRYSHNGLSFGYHKRLAEIYRNIIPAGQSVLEIGCGCGDLLDALQPFKGLGIDFSEAMVERAKAKYPHLDFMVADAHDLSDLSDSFDVIIFSDLINDLWDLQLFFEQLHCLCSPSTRVIFNFYSHLWAMPLRLARVMGMATPMLPQNWLTVDDLIALLNLTDFELVSHRSEILCPVAIPLLSPFCNRFLAKLKPFSWCNLTHIMVARQVVSRGVDNASNCPTVSVIVPARNEAGNISEILRRIPQMGNRTEVIFIEGGSTDHTYEAIQSEIDANRKTDCAVFKQGGVGKGDAVRMGFEKASGDVLMILDADLTVAPENLPKFYNALVSGHGELINGVRLVYPMHEKAMRFLNLVANKFFSVVFTWLLGQPVKDTLCGTKVLWKKDYLEIAAQRDYFGDFDPFGDFDLLFGAARLNLKIVDLPVRYGERTYGATNINRWSHGLLLSRMVVFAARKLKFK